MNGIAAALSVVILVGQQSPTFKATAHVVQVEVQVLRGRQPVTGLTAEDFELHDNGKSQTVRLSSFDAIPVSLLLVLDTSESVRGQRLEQLRSAVEKTVLTLREQDSAAIITFGDRVRLLHGWTTRKDSLVQAVKGIQPSGGTGLYDAVVAAVGFRGGAPGRPLVIVFSDGVDTTSWTDAESALQHARQSDFAIYSVTAEDEVPKARLEQLRAFRQRPELRAAFRGDPSLFPFGFFEALADVTAGEALYVSDSKDIATLLQTIVGMFTSSYLLSYTPTESTPGWHAIDVKLRRRAGTVRARDGYMRFENPR